MLVPENDGLYSSDLTLIKPSFLVFFPPILQKFLADTKTLYLAELEAVDFISNAEAARVKINKWVEKKTQGNHQSVLKPKQHNLTYKTPLFVPFCHCRKNETTPLIRLMIYLCFNFSVLDLLIHLYCRDNQGSVGWRDFGYLYKTCAGKRPLLQRRLGEEVQHCQDHWSTI